MLVKLTCGKVPLLGVMDELNVMGLENPLLAAVVKLKLVVPPSVILLDAGEQDTEKSGVGAA